MQEFLLQISKRDGSILNIGVYDDTTSTPQNPAGEYQTDMGYIHDQFELDFYEYKHMGWDDLRVLLNQDSSKEFLKQRLK